MSDDVPYGVDRGNAGSLFGEAIALTGRRPLLLPALLLLLLLTASNIVVLRNLPAEGGTPPLAFLLAAIVRVAGVIYLAVVILRTLVRSDRPRWLPDGALWLYGLTFVIGVAVQAAVGLAIGDLSGVAGLLLTNVMVTLLLSPLIAWFVAIAVARPLAWRPSPWLQDFRRWLPALLLWTLLLVTPLAVLHAWIDRRLIEGVGDMFWPLALFDGALSTLLATTGLALNAAAYRRVKSAG